MTRPPQVPATPGDKFAAALRTFAKNIQERTPINSHSCRIQQTPNGWWPEWTPPKKRGVAQAEPLFQMFKVIAAGAASETAGDVIYCRPISEQGEMIGPNWPTQVAKPWKLRKTPWHGFTINGLTYRYRYGNGQRREVVGPLGSPTIGARVQTIVPRYNVYRMTPHPVTGIEEEMFSDMEPSLNVDKITYSDLILGVRFPTPHFGFQWDAAYVSGSDTSLYRWLDMNVDGREWGTAVVQV